MTSPLTPIPSSTHPAPKAAAAGLVRPNGTWQTLLNRLQAKDSPYPRPLRMLVSKYVTNHTDNPNLRIFADNFDAVMVLLDKEFKYDNLDEDLATIETNPESRANIFQKIDTIVSDPEDIHGYLQAAASTVAFPKLVP